MQLLLVKLSAITIEDNVSRGADYEHSPKRIRAHAERIVKNDYWDPPDVIKTHHPNRYNLAAGFKRIHSAHLLDSEGRLPAVCGSNHAVWVLVHDKPPKERDHVNIAENFDRENPSSYQKAHALKEMQERHKLTAEELSREGLTAKTIQNYIRAAKNLIPEIQLAWQNFEDTDKSIPLTRLLSWAALAPDEQKKQFDASKWGRIYTLSDQPTVRTNLRPRRKIINLLESTTNPTIKETLEWVLCLRDELTEEEDARRSSNRRDRSDRGQADGGTTSPGRGEPSTSHHSRPTPSNGESRSMQQDAERRPNLSPEPLPPGTRGKRRTTPRGD